MLLSQPTAGVEFCDDDHLTKEIRPDGTYYEYKYDNNGNLSLVENALGSKTQLKYNEYRKVAEATDNNGNVTWYEYDSALNCIKVTDAEVVSQSFLMMQEIVLHLLRRREVLRQKT